jgi:hypothetical protein
MTEMGNSKLQKRRTPEGFKITLEPSILAPSGTPFSWLPSEDLGFG